MPSLPEIATDDRDRFFADWGRPATLRQITPYTDQATGRVDEFAVHTPLTVVGGHQLSTRLNATAADVTTRTTHCLIRTADLPPDLCWPSCRLIFDEQEFLLIERTEGPWTGTVLLTCKALG